MIRLAKLLQLFGLLVMPAALIIGFSNVPRAGEVELAIMGGGVLVFALGREVEKRIPR